MTLKTKIERKLKKKKNPELVETIIKAKKNKAWLEIGNLISGPKRRQISVNLERIEEETEEGDTVIVPGKVLSKGEISKKVRVVALSFSKEAREKLKAKSCEIVSVLGEIKKNPKAAGVKIIK